MENISRHKFVRLLLIKYLFGLIILGLVFFLTAGTIRFWHTWILFALGYTVIFLVFRENTYASRILNEERLLKKNLPGYLEYTHKVRYRLIPKIW